jgi:hypothetical protein
MSNAFGGDIAMNSEPHAAPASSRAVRADP